MAGLTGTSNHEGVDHHHEKTIKTPFLIGVAGGTSSGKFSVCQKIMEGLGQSGISDSKRKVVCVSQDSFYKQLTGKLTPTNNYDHPNALDQDLLLKTLQDLLDGRVTQVQQYDYVANAPKEGEFVTLYPADVVLFEGILAFYFPEVRNLFNMKLFVDTDADTRLYRRVIRDVETNGRDLEFVLNHYMDFVKPSFEEFCLPTKKFADVIIPRGADNTVAISLIVQHIQEMNVRKNGISNGDPSQQSPPSRPANKRQLKKELSRPH